MSATDVAWKALFAHRTRFSSGEITAILALADATGIIAFSGGFPAPETFPTDELSAIAASLFDNEPAVALQYSPTPGLPGFRDAIAGRLEHSEGRRPTDGELLVTSGGIDALSLIGRSLLNQGDT